MGRKLMVMSVVILGIFLVLSSTALASSGKKWNDHDAPWDFFFNDTMHDGHHEFKAVGQLNDNGYPEKANGFMYISYDEDGNAIHGTDRVGWQVHGIFGNATYNGESAEYLWTVNAEAVPKPQGYVHWHPLDGRAGKVIGDDYPGYFLKHTAVESFYFLPQSRWVSPGIDYDIHNDFNTSL
ncbi:hypothetical protein V7O66_02450 [Methanolobus sp. ZRKC3]|uniref:hypothetical protein n=1 Tax=Methanolobus sp. ZRKC3 TaxID=3125786 RepID=UPI0032509CFC